MTEKRKIFTKTILIFFRFNTCAEPGPIDNSDFLCQHGAIHPDREIVFEHLAIALPLQVYEYLHKKFGGCSPITSMTTCHACLAFNTRLLGEMERFVLLSREAQAQDIPSTHLISAAWYAQWHTFVHKRTSESPGPIDNSKININQIDGKECVEVSEGIWDFFYNIYGGGPEIRLRTKLLQRAESEESLGGEVVADFVIPTLKKEKEEKIDRSIYCSGEPIEIMESEAECNGFDNGEGVKDEISSDLPLTNGLPFNRNRLSMADDCSEDEKKEIRNIKRYRRRRKALSSVI